MSKDVFISYKSEDFDKVTYFKNILEENGITCWMAPMSIPMGSNYAVEIPNAISECKVFLLMLSSKAQNSQWVPKELDQAISCGKTIKPVMIEDCELRAPFNFYLSNIQRYNAFRNVDAALRDIIMDIRAHVSIQPEINAVPIMNDKKPGLFQRIFGKKIPEMPKQEFAIPVTAQPVVNMPQVPKAVQTPNAPAWEEIKKFVPGDIVGNRYEIIKEIGQGGNAEVYLAKDKELDLLVAVKCMRSKNYTNYETAKEALRREFETQKRCVHSGFAIIRGSVETETEFIIIMDYIEGKSLNDLIMEKGHLNEAEVIDIALQLCDVFHYLHTRENPLYFRDAKPSNVIVKPNNEVVLIDFGTAVEETEVTLADTTALGTNGYAAPEQYGGKVDARTDVYNLGATLYHAITGWNPAEPPYEFLPVREVVPDCSSEIERIIEKTVYRNPEKRYQTMLELKADLERIK